MSTVSKPNATRSNLDLQPLLALLNSKAPDVRFEAWDGSWAGPNIARSTITFVRPRAFLRIARAPRGLGLARAFIEGDITISGDIASLGTSERHLFDIRLVARVVAVATRIFLQASPEERAATGRIPTEFIPHPLRPRTIEHDREAIAHHYDVSPEFYAKVLGPTMTYSGAIFRDATSTLDGAQNEKHRTICEKLRLDSNSKLLDVGCGWGGLLRYASNKYGCDTIGVTASKAQYNYIMNGQLPSRTRIALGDYRETLPTAGVTAAASIGIYEHIGSKLSLDFFDRIRGCLAVDSWYLNQSIVRLHSGFKKVRRNSFAERFVFPNGQLRFLSDQLFDLEKSRFQVVSVEMFGDSYASTLEQWIENLELHEQFLDQLVGGRHVRTWHAYMIGARQRFIDHSIDLVQVLSRALP